MKLLQRYAAFMENRPFVGTVLTSAALTCLGDANIQIFFEDRSLLPGRESDSGPAKGFDILRNLQAFTIGVMPRSLNQFFWNFRVMPWLLNVLGHCLLVRKAPNVAKTLLRKYFY